MGADRVASSQELADILDEVVEQELKNMKEHSVRLLKVECSCGSMQQFVNLPLDHGVYAHSDDQPLLNANDFVPEKHIYMMGRCNSKVNPENDEFKKCKKYFMNVVFGGPVGMINNTLDCAKELFGFGGADCVPIIEEVWKKGHEHSCLDGAPAINCECTCLCKNGGIISFSEISMEELKASMEASEEANQNQEDTSADAESEDGTESGTGDGEGESDDILDSLPEKMAEQIRDMNAIGADMDLADSMQSEALDWYSQNPVTADGPTALNYYGMLQNSYYNNNAMMPYGALNSYGFITDSSGLSMFNIANTNVGSMGGCAMGTYNLFQGIGMPQSMGKTISMIEGFQTVPGYVDIGPTSVNIMTMSNCARKCGCDTKIMSGTSFQTYGVSMPVGDVAVVANPNYKTQAGEMEFTTFKQTETGLVCQERPQMAFSQICGEEQLGNSYFMHVSKKNN